MQHLTALRAALQPDESLDFFDLATLLQPDEPVDFIALGASLQPDEPVDDKDLTTELPLSGLPFDPSDESVDANLAAESCKIEDYVSAITHKYGINKALVENITPQVVTNQITKVKNFRHRPGSEMAETSKRVNELFRHLMGAIIWDKAHDKRQYPRNLTAYYQRASHLLAKLLFLLLLCTDERFKSNSVNFKKEMAPLSKALHRRVKAALPAAAKKALPRMIPFVDLLRDHGPELWNLAVDEIYRYRIRDETGSTHRELARNTLVEAKKTIPPEVADEMNFTPPPNTTAGKNPKGTTHALPKTPDDFFKGVGTMWVELSPQNPRDWLNTVPEFLRDSNGDEFICFTPPAASPPVTDKSNKI
jgi:hypothetical protein